MIESLMAVTNSTTTLGLTAQQVSGLNFLINIQISWVQKSGFKPVALFLGKPHYLNVSVSARLITFFTATFNGS